MGVRVVTRMLETGRFDLAATGDMLLDPDMLLGAAGGVVGYTVASKVASLFMPPGVGIFVQMLPRFAGAALGFEMGRGSIGDADPVALLAQALVSTAGYSAVHLLFGATAPGWLLMGGATIAGVLMNLLIRPKVSVSEDRPSIEQEHPEEEGGAEVGPAAPAATDEGYRALVRALEARSPDLEVRYRSYAGRGP